MKNLFLKDYVRLVGVKRYDGDTLIWQTLKYGMSRTPPWVPGLILNAAGFEAEHYKKDD